MIRKEEVRLNGKVYSVTFREDGAISIWVQWEVPSVADRFSVRPMMVAKSASVSPYGRLGKKILAAITPLRAKVCTPVDVQTAAALLV